MQVPGGVNEVLPTVRRGMAYFDLSRVSLLHCQGCRCALCIAIRQQTLPPKLREHVSHMRIYAFHWRLMHAWACDAVDCWLCR